MEDIISGTDKPKESPKRDETASKSTLQMLAAAKPKDTIVTPVTLPTPLTPETIVRVVTPLTPVTSITNEAEELPIAPMRNFQKVSNAITKQAIPQGVFKSGKSKELYDVLYSLTRGAINPSRKVRISKPKLQKLAGIGAPQTLNQGLMHLQLVGLVRINAVEGGKHEGHEYEVLLYEETVKATGVTPLTPVTLVRNLPPLPSLENNSPYGSLNVENKHSSDENKTLSLNTSTKTEDDRAAAFSDVIEKLDAASRKLTGKGISRRDADKWSDFADLIVLELEIAAKRTNAISSVPAFLTEVLRRRLFAQRQQQASNKSSKAKPDTVGKSDFESYEIKPLDEKDRKEALNQLWEFAGDDFLEDFKKWYTHEDWTWLMKELEKK